LLSLLFEWISIAFDIKIVFIRNQPELNSLAIYERSYFSFRKFGNVQIESDLVLVDDEGVLAARELAHLDLEVSELKVRKKFNFVKQFPPCAVSLSTDPMSTRRSW
jgi:hypothetical protein